MAAGLLDPEVPFARPDAGRRVDEGMRPDEEVSGQAGVSRGRPFEGFACLEIGAVLAGARPLLRRLPRRGERDLHHVGLRPARGCDRNRGEACEHDRRERGDDAEAPL